MGSSPIIEQVAQRTRAPCTHRRTPLPRSLDLVVTSVATQLMGATGSTATQVSEQVLAQLVEQFDLYASFLRHHDHDIRASVLVAPTPPPTNARAPAAIADVPRTTPHP